MMEDIIKERIEKSRLTKEKFFKKNFKTLLAVVEVLVNSFKQGRHLFIFGNGGSAADAQHIAAEFVNRYLIERDPLPALALTTDTSILTSVSNDTDFSNVFSIQIKALGKKGDVAWGITTSGRSENVIKGLKEAKMMQMHTIALIGTDGSHLLPFTDHILFVESDFTPIIQEVHIMVGHIICELVERKLFLKDL